eukprot:CAMPEP_0197032012 /NCGR_PEP_ID=MMETSP1384-20130603/10800_1 /TAXON_ID=29189 /ORGANISM="Ammonia sp." /LENGTH=224 /DNA_ID=CAMNT_0042461605 /DNA_START=183 /DNA_END=853 /DNA_ORIENTATION=-
MVLGGSSYVFMYKSWMLWYHASLMEAYADIEWKTYISNTHNESNNWYIKNQHSYGNPKYALSFTLVLLSISSLFGLLAFHYDSLEYKVTILLSSLLPSMVTMIISIKTPVIHDIFRIQREIKLYLKFGSVAILSLYIYLFGDLFTSPDSSTAASWLHLVFIAIPSVALFASVYVQTQHIITTFKDEILIDSNNRILHEKMQIQIDETSQRDLALHIIHTAAATT